ncbi:MAG: PIN domain-containing protein [Deltaproteobacteria bacterium]|nr:PIN domain-containing protein [Deltaproteobacteria bacterium]MBI4373728.1 PIN domain-containing protein [Deltaproteobacteria bacterium]
MPSDKPVLIDTSIWISYFQRQDPSLEKTVDELLENGRVATAAIIVAEMVQGARSEAEAKKIREYFAPLFWIESSDRHWEIAGELSFRLRRKGRSVNLTDCYIAALTKGDQVKVLSLDKHFQWIAAEKGCDLESSNKKR